MEAVILNMRISGFGHALFGIAVAGLAILSLVYGNFAPIMEPFPAYGSGAILLAASAGLFFARTLLASAIIIGAYESVWAVTRAHAVLLKPLIIGSWYGFSEALGPLLGAWILFAVLRRQYAAGFGLLVGVLPRLAATLEAIMMSLFGALVCYRVFLRNPRLNGRLHRKFNGRRPY